MPRKKPAADDWKNIRDRKGGKVLDFRVGSERYEIHMINVGGTFAGFGGSSANHLVTKTASMIVRHHSAGGTRDSEFDIYDPVAWHWLSKLLDPARVSEIETGLTK